MTNTNSTAARPADTPPPPLPFPARFAMSHTHRGQVWKRPPHIADNDNGAKKKGAAA